MAGRRSTRPARTQDSTLLGAEWRHPRTPRGGMHRRPDADMIPRQPPKPPGQATYGIDAPNILIGLVAAALLFLLVGFFFAAGRSPAWGIGPWAISGVLAAAAAWVAHGTLRAKPAFWRSALDDLHLRGSEDALDLGCGR